MAQDTGALLINAGNSFASSINNAGALRLDREREARVAKFQEENAAFEREKFNLAQQAAKQKSNVNILTTAASLAKTDPETAKFILESAFTAGGGDPKDPSFKRFGTLLDKKIKDDAATTAEILNYAASKGLSVPDVAKSFSDPDALIGFLKDFQSFKAEAEKGSQPSVKLPGGELATPDAAAAEAAKSGGIIPAGDTDVSVKNIHMPDGTVRGFDAKTAEGREGIRAALKAGGSLITTAVQAGTVGDLSTDKITAREVSQIFTAARQVNAISDRVVAQLGDVDVKTGLTSGVVRGLDSMANQLTQLAGVFQKEDKEFLTELRTTAVKRFNLTELFGEQATKSAAFRSNIINLAYASARAEGQTARALSDKDLEAQFKKIAASSGSKGQMKAAIAEVVRNAKSNAAIALRSAQDFGALPGMEVPEDLRLDTPAASPAAAADKPAIAPGTIKTLRGKRFVTDGKNWFQLP